MLDVQAVARFMFKHESGAGRGMTEMEEPVEASDAALARLESALERIERSAKPAPPSEVARRLDALIAHLRGALDEATA